MPNPDLGGKGACAHCQKPSTTRCTGCLGAPEYHNTTASATFYCNKECQKSDWQRHKSQCHILQARKKLARAAELLQSIFYRIRMHAYDKQIGPFKFNSMRPDGSKIYLDGIESSWLQRPPTMRQFPISFEQIEDQDKVEAVLAYVGCTEALLYLHDFAGKLLAGEPSFPHSVHFLLLNRIQVYALRSRKCI